MRNRQYSIDSLTVLFYRCVETYNYFSEPKFYLKTKMFTIWLYGLFSYFGMVYCFGGKMSLIKSSLLNITPDFNFHLLFYCFSPCSLSLPHILHVFNPPLKTFIASFPIVLQASLWGLHAYTPPSEDCLCGVFTVWGLLAALTERVDVLPWLIRNFIMTFLCCSWVLCWCHQELKGDELPGLLLKLAEHSITERLRLIWDQTVWSWHDLVHLTQSHLQLLVQDCVGLVFEYLHRWKLHNLSGQSGASAQSPTQ